jgi:hypothetical protein
VITTSHFLNRRVIVLWTMMPGAQLADVITALAGDLALLPWSRQWHPASERSCLDWRKAPGPAPLEELQDAVLAAAVGEHAERDGQALTIGKGRPLTAGSADGSLLRVPDTPRNRAGFGSVGTADDSAAWPCVRLFCLNDAFTRSLLAMPWGPAGSDKAASEQRLLDAAMKDFPHVLSKDRVWLLDRLWHSVPRLKALAGLTHWAVRLKSDITLKRASEIYPDHSYLAEVSGDGVTMTVRVIEYFIDIEGQEVNRGDAPLWQPGAHRAGDRGLGVRDRDDPRCHPRCRPCRGPGKEGEPGRAGRHRPEHVHGPVPPPRPRRDPLRGDRLQGADRQDRGIPGRHRPEPAPAAQVQVAQHVRARRREGHHHPYRPGRHHHGQHTRLNSENTRNSFTADTSNCCRPPSRPVEPARLRHGMPATVMPENGNYATSPKREPPIKA